MLQVVTKTVNVSLGKYNSIFKKASCLLVFSIITASKINPIFAQEKIVINQTTINNNIAVSGISGGTVKAFSIAQTENTSTGYCDGFVNSQPNHILKIDTFFNSLRLEIEGSADTTILIKGAGGTWCNDDAGSANPMIEGQWQPGIYQIWVGSYQANSSNNYQIKITNY